MSNRTLAFTAERLLHVLETLPDANAYIVGFSGGADSTALLHALSTVKNQLGVPVSAVHVNHGLHEDADHWQQRCESFCRQNNIELVTLRIELENCSGKGLEAEARHLRYEAISNLLIPGACLLTAHHADDQAETLLLNLMRGSGVDGLSAMPESRPFGNGLLQRPMLGLQNDAIKAYLREKNIGWTEDPSNKYLNHDRNFVRHEIIPLLEKRWPEVSKRLLLTQNAMTDARYLLERLADEYLEQNLNHPFVLEITSLIIDDPKLFKLVMRRWMNLSDRSTIPAYRLEGFYQQVQAAHSDQRVIVSWDGWVLHLYKQQLWLHTDKDILPCRVVEWPTDHSEIDLGIDAGQLVFQKTDETANQSEGWPVQMPPTKPAGEFSVGGRNSMDETVIGQGVHHKSLKNLFQTVGIPPWLRDCIPLCKLDGELVALGDWCFKDSFESWMSENGIKLSWHPRHPLLQYIHAQQLSQIVDPADAVR